MKRIAAVAAMTLALAGFANAGINVQWSGLDGFVKIDGSTGITAGGASTVAYLVFSATGSSYGTDLNPGSFTQGDETILGTIIGVTGDDFGTVFTQNTGDLPFTAGFIYARVFDAPTSSGVGQPLADTWYYEGPSVAVQNITDPTSPQLYNMNTGSANIPGFATDIVNRQVVPEPSTLALLGLTGLVIAARPRLFSA